MNIRYSIYDTKAEEHISDNDHIYEYVSGGYRIGGLRWILITKIIENRYEAYIDNVMVHTKEKYADWGGVLARDCCENFFLSPQCDNILFPFTSSFDVYSKKDMLMLPTAK